MTLTEKEIAKKVEDYRQKMNQDLAKLINDEKEKEAERTKAYDEEADPEEKKKLEVQISAERGQSSQRVMKMNTY
jgi:hypothetical protein